MEEFAYWMIRVLLHQEKHTARCLEGDIRSSLDKTGVSCFTFETHWLVEKNSKFATVFKVLFWNLALLMFSFKKVLNMTLYVVMWKMLRHFPDRLLLQVSCRFLLIKDLQLTHDWNVSWTTRFVWMFTPPTRSRKWKFRMVYPILVVGAGLNVSLLKPLSGKN